MDLDLAGLLGELARQLLEPGVRDPGPHGERPTYKHLEILSAGWCRRKESPGGESFEKYLGESRRKRPAGWDLMGSLGGTWPGARFTLNQDT